MSGFSFGEEAIALPTGAFAGTRRRMLRLDGRAVLGVTAGVFRPYLYPVYTPTGVAVTAEGPADHPHHHSLWAGADHLHLKMPAMGGRDEVYAYNCYVNDIFQGRAPGRAAVTGLAGHARGGAYAIEQAIDWRGPVEWGAPQGRLILVEARETVVRVCDACVCIDMACELKPAEHDIAIGPTRHAWFNFRVAPSLCVDEGGVVLDDAGHSGPGQGIAAHARWVAAVGPAGGGRTAGIAMAPQSCSASAAKEAPWWWFVSDWGVVTASPCRDDPIELVRGASVQLAARFVVFDGAADAARIARMLAGTT